MNTPSTVVCWKWRPQTPRYRSTFGATQVNTLRKMVERHYHRPHEFVCVTDDPTGLDPEVRVVPLWNDHANVINPHGMNNPSCYRRLKAFSREAEQWFGPRFVSLDLDVVLTADVTPLWDRPEDFVIWGDTAIGTPYNGSMFLLTSGSRPQVWERFDPRVSPRLGRERRYIGSDQAWIAVALGPHEAKWTKADGVFSFRNEVLKRPHGGLPRGARLVVFHGQHDPWDPGVQRNHPWIRDHYR